MPPRHIDETRITGRLPTVDIEMTHRRLPERDAEELSITMVATPSFEAFARVVEAGNPFLAWISWNPLGVWMSAMEQVWLSWARSMVLPAPRQPSPRRHHRAEDTG
jgi:hypothetical protein